LKIIFSAENHRINIYYPTTAGGGHQKLFRKVLNRSSEYCQELILKRYQESARGTLIFVRPSICIDRAQKGEKRSALKGRFNISDVFSIFQT